MLSQDFKEFIGSLNDNGVEYLIIGGYAVAFHGYPRYTKDLDIWIQVSTDNAARMIKALADFGFASLGLTQNDFMEQDRIIQLGHPPNRIDVITGVDGVEFSQCYPSRLKIEIDGVEVCFIDLDNLKRNKKASGRHQDLADLENLAN